jgi:ribosomal protein L16 Arg81 hydroxylase
MTLLADRGKAAPGAQPFPGMSQLIHPVGVAVFQRDYCEQQPLLVQREDRGYYAELLTLGDVDQILSSSNVLCDNLRVVTEGKDTPLTEAGSPPGRGLAGRNRSVNALEELYSRYRGGSTIVLNELEQRWEPLQRMCRALGAEISARIQANVYLTPAGSQGFRPHYDTHDVFIAQVHGTKHWRLAGMPYELPLQSKPHDKSQPEPASEREFDLRAGDVLYLPRGTVHSATSNETASVHITIGVHPVLYSQILVDAVKKLCNQDVRFRKGLPIGFARDGNLQRQAADTLAGLVETLAAVLSPRDMVAASVAHEASASLPLLRHHLTDLEKAGDVSVGTRLRRRAGQRWHLTVSDGVVALEFHNKTVRLPARVAGEVRYLAESNGDGFTPRDIPGDLDEPGRLVLVRALLGEGFLTLG